MSDEQRAEQTGINVVADSSCACTGCPMHDICRQTPEANDTMCVWCRIEVNVENRWQAMLSGADEEDDDD